MTTETLSRQIQLVAENQWGFYDFFGNSPTHRHQQSEPWHWLRAEVTIWPSYFTYAFSPKANPQELLQGMRDNSLPRQVWLDVRPQFEPLEEALTAAGADLMAEYPGMYADLSPLIATPLPPGLEIAPVTDEDMLRDWATVIIRGWWSGDDERIDTLCQVYRHLYPLPEMTLWLAKLEDKPVGTALSFQTGNTIGLYMITTMPELRNRGIGHQLTLLPMLAARNQGCRHGALYATPEGRRVYEKLGFREVAKARIYFLPVEQSKT